MNRPTRILLVDDDPVILSTFSEILRLEGYEVREAETGRAALQIALEGWPDLVVLDVRLPDISGIEVCRQIKAEAGLQDVIVVLLSGEATSSPQQITGLESGADEYLLKPIPGEEFVARIRTLTRLHNTTAALRASQERHRQAVELLPELFFLIEADGRILSVNARAVQELGYADDKGLLQNTIFELIPRAEHERMRGHLLAILEKSPAKEVEYHLLSKRGELLTVEVSLAVLPDAEMLPAGLVFVARNITERRTAEKQVRLLADAVESANECICVADSQNRLVFVNHAVCCEYTKPTRASGRSFLR